MLSNCKGAIQINIAKQRRCVRTRKGLADYEEDDEQDEEDAAVELARGPDDLGVREARRGIERVGHLENVLEEVGGVRVDRRGQSRHGRGGISTGAGTGPSHLVEGGSHHGRCGRGGGVG